MDIWSEEASDLRMDGLEVVSLNTLWFPGGMDGLRRGGCCTLWVRQSDTSVGMNLDMAEALRGL